jgi:hypothetical protein
MSLSFDYSRYFIVNVMKATAKVTPEGYIETLGDPIDSISCEKSRLY